MKIFKDRVAVITGAANGLGRELANVAADLGMRLVLADVQREALDVCKRDFESLGSNLLTVECDVSKYDDVKKLADATIERFGAVHLLFNNAGVGAGGYVWENTEADWEWVLGVNLWGAIHGINAFTPLMLEAAKQDVQYEAHIINTSSVAGLLNSPLLGIYNTSKHAVVALSESLYHDLKLTTAAVNCTVLCPFWMQTKINESQRNRPVELSNAQPLTKSQKVAAALVDKAVQSATVSPRVVAELTFEAIRENRFYLHSDASILRDVETKMQNILNQQNPSDPYEHLPHVRRYVEAGLKR